MLYVVDRPSSLFGPRAAGIFTRRDEALQFARSSDFRAFVWEQVAEGAGWLLVRWKGLDLDYGAVVHRMRLPDESEAGIEHDRARRPWTLLRIADWKSERKMPRWLKELRGE